MESKYYKKGCQNEIMEVQRQCNLRNKKVLVNIPKKSYVDAPTLSQKNVDPLKHIPQNKDIAIKELEKGKSSFILENEISKIKISIPFNELIKNDIYKSQIVKELKI